MTENTPNPPAEKEPGFFAENKKLIVAGLVVILMLLFIFMNMDEVEFWLFFKVKMPMVVVILMFFSIGAIGTWVYAHFGRKELKKKLREAEKKLKSLGH